MLSFLMDRRSVAKLFQQKRAHSLQHLRQQRSSGIRIEVNSPHNPILREADITNPATDQNQHNGGWDPDGCPTFAQAYSGFPVELSGVGELHAAFLNESRTRGRWWRPVQEIRIRGTKTMGEAQPLLLAQHSTSHPHSPKPARLLLPSASCA
jgi:hypothetical protein